MNRSDAASSSSSPGATLTFRARGGGGGGGCASHALSSSSPSGDDADASDDRGARRPLHRGLKIGGEQHVAGVVGSGGPGGGGLSRPSRTPSAIQLCGYELPFFRARSRRSRILLALAALSIALSLLTAMVGSASGRGGSWGYGSGGAPPLPSSAKDWGEGREERRRARRKKRGETASSATAPASKERGGNEELKVPAVMELQHVEGVAAALSKLFEEGRSMLPSLPDPVGRDVGDYASAGCAALFSGDEKDGGRGGRRQRPPSFSVDDMRKSWVSHLPSILAASRHADDPNFAREDWTKVLLRALSSRTLGDGLAVTFGAGGESGDERAKDVERLVGIVSRRLLALKGGREKPSSGGPAWMPPPLRIAVFGGPTIEGKGCRRARAPTAGGSIMANPTFCAFPYLLERFLNGMLLPPGVWKKLGVSSAGGGGEDFRVVEVVNLGEEGTDSEFSAAITRNRMYPHPSFAASTGYGGGPPDLIVHAYGIDEYGQSPTDMRPFYDAVRKSSGTVKEGCDEVHKKPSPVVVRAVLEENQKEGSDPSVMTVVLGDAVDDVEEGELSLPEIPGANAFGEEGGALGMAGHVVTSWVLAFDLAYAALNYCAATDHGRGSTDDKPPPVKDEDKSKAVTAVNKPPPPPNPFHCDNGISPPCVFSFLAGPKGTASRPSAIANTLLPYVVENTGWQPEADMTAGFARKTGLVGSGSGATMTLLFRNVTRSVKRFDVVTLRSTSNVWKNGVARFVLVTGGDFSHGTEAAEASADTARETSFEVSAELGKANQNSPDRHVSYHFGLDVVDDQNTGRDGTDVLIRMILVKGDKFKVLGVMLCE